MDNVLDLTDANVVKKLNIDPSRLTILKETNPSAYNYTHQIGNRAFVEGYNGILFPSAQMPGGQNLLIFGGRRSSVGKIFDVNVGAIGR